METWETENKPPEGKMPSSNEVMRIPGGEGAGQSAPVSKDMGSGSTETTPKG